MTPDAPAPSDPSAAAALARLAVLTPGLDAAALLDASGALVAGDAALAAAAAAPGGPPVGVVVVRAPEAAGAPGPAALARVSGPVLPGLLRADLAAALALAGLDRAT
jgi:hypothetical protein